MPWSLSEEFVNRIDALMVRCSGLMFFFCCLCMFLGTINVGVVVAQSVTQKDFSNYQLSVEARLVRLEAAQLEITDMKWLDRLTNTFILLLGGGFGANHVVEKMKRRNQ